MFAKAQTFFFRCKCLLPATNNSGVYIMYFLDIFDIEFYFAHILPFSRFYIVPYYIALSLLISITTSQRQPMMSPCRPKLRVLIKDLSAKYFLTVYTEAPHILYIYN